MNSSSLKKSLVWFAFAAILLGLSLCSESCAGVYRFPAGYLDQAYVPDSLAADREDLRYIIGSAHYMRNEWELSPYYRIGDEVLIVPIQVLINSLDEACIVPDQVFALQPRWCACPKGWRRPRAVNLPYRPLPDN